MVYLGEGLYWCNNSRLDLIIDYEEYSKGEGNNERNSNSVNSINTYGSNGISHNRAHDTQEQGSCNALLCNIGDTVYIVNFCPKERTDEIFGMPIRGEEWWIDRYTVRSEHSRYTMSGLILRGVAFLEEKDAMAYLQKARAEYENGQRGK